MRLKPLFAITAGIILTSLAACDPVSDDDIQQSPQEPASASLTSDDASALQTPSPIMA